MPHRSRLWRLALVSLLAHGGLPAPEAAAQVWESAIVYEGEDGALTYVRDAEGNRVPDFSDAGYGGGGVPLPEVPAVLTLAPTAGDNTERIQDALDAIGEMTPDADGFRGALLLLPGQFELSGTVLVRHSGVVLRGSGSGTDPETNTILYRRLGATQMPVVALGTRTSNSRDALIRRDDSRDTSLVTDAAVEIGARTVGVEKPELFASGDEVVVYHPATAEWLEAVEGGGTGPDPAWDVGLVPIALARRVLRVDGDRLVLDAPAFVHMDTDLSPVYVYHRDRTDVVKRVGIEDLRIEIETESPTSETHARDGVRFVLTENAWASGVVASHFWESGFNVQYSRHVTIQDCEALEPHSELEGGRRYNFEVDSSQLVLVRDSRATASRHAYVTNGQALDSGVVFLDNVSEGARESSEGHRRWSNGVLWDNHTETGSSGNGWFGRRLHMGNRGSFGTSHGWSCANCVAWNAEMGGAPLVAEKPPTAQNYSIGTQGGLVLATGPFVDEAASYVEGTDTPGLAPRSLYLRQLQDRLATTGASPPAPEARGVTLRPLAPNPSRGAVEVRFWLAEPGPARLAIVDALGREVAALARGPHAAGEHRAALDTGRLAPGVYAVRLQTERGAAVQRLTVVR